MKKIAVLISGQGSNLQAIIEACQTGFIRGKIVTVISNKIDSFGLERAESADIPSRVFLRQDFASNLDMDKAIGDYLEDLNVDLIVLAGYMKILTKPFTQRFAGKILNIHPSLLPKYPGLHTYQRALENGDSEHGTTVHFVNEEIDGGAIVLQAKVPIFPGDTAEEIELRTREQEYNIYPLVIKWFIEERLKLIENQAYLDGKLLPPNGYAYE
jgi:phosphoribosylglycinamide formyltransferase-1